MTIKCSSCNRYLPKNHTGSCPNCGGTNKHFIHSVNATLNVRASTKIRIITNYYRKNYFQLCLLISLTIAVIVIIGQFLTGWLGIAISIIIGISIVIIFPGFKEKVEREKSI